MKNKIPFVAAALLAAPVLLAEHADFVTINASASPVYTQQKFAGGAPKPESYVLFQGKFFGGETHDPSVDHATFTAIGRTLAPDLAKQNYLPTRNAPGADLLIVVNWGTTEVDSNNVPPPSSDEEYRQSALGANSYLLGYDRALQLEGHMDWATPSGMNAVEESHYSQLTDERYFVILLAYNYQKIQQQNRDYQALRKTNPREAQRLGPPQPKPVWSVRMNVRAAGNNFTQALPAMSDAAADYFGRQVDDLVDRPAVVGPNAHVEVGEVKELNVVK